MNTPAHILLAAGLFAKPDCPKITAGAIIGGFIPDLSLYTMAAFSLLVEGNSPRYVFDVQFFSNTWQQVFAVDNSFVLWGLLLLFALWLRKAWLIVFAAAAISHLCLDFPLHHTDARMHFWPISNWIFHSPVSYWNPHYHGNLIAALERLMVAGVMIILWLRFKSWKMRAFYTGLAVVEFAPFIIFHLILHGP
jgi:hypothetical protein